MDFSFGSKLQESYLISDRRVQQCQSLCKMRPRVKRKSLYRSWTLLLVGCISAMSDERILNEMYEVKSYKSFHSSNIKDRLKLKDDVES